MNLKLSLLKIQQNNKRVGCFNWHLVFCSFGRRERAVENFQFALILLNQYAKKKKKKEKNIKYQHSRSLMLMEVHKHVNFNLTSIFLFIYFLEKKILNFFNPIEKIRLSKYSYGVVSTNSREHLAAKRAAFHNVFKNIFTCFLFFSSF